MYVFTEGFKVKHSNWRFLLNSLTNYFNFLTFFIYCLNFRKNQVSSSDICTYRDPMGLKSSQEIKIICRAIYEKSPIGIFHYKPFSKHIHLYSKIGKNKIYSNGHHFQTIHWIYVTF